MADFIFITGGFPTQQETSSSYIEADSSGNTVFENPAYLFFATFPSLNLQPVTSNVPILLKKFGWLNGG